MSPTRIWSKTKPGLDWIVSPQGVGLDFATGPQKNQVNLQYNLDYREEEFASVKLLDNSSMLVRLAFMQQK